MGRYRTAFNTTDRPVVIDDEGRIAAGGEWTPVLASNDLVREAVDRGDLVFVDEPGGDTKVTGQAAEAFAAVAELNAADTPDELADAAEEHGATPTAAAKRAATRKEKEAEQA